MLNYTTTTIVNSAGNVVFCNGTHLYNASASTTAIENAGTNVSQKFMRVNFGPKIVNDGIIHKACLVGLKAYTAATPATLHINLLSEDSGSNPIIDSTKIYRIGLYLRQRNNNSPIFSNTWVFKGKPIYIEFKGDATSEEIADLIDKYMLNIYGESIFSVTSTYVTTSGSEQNELDITAKDQWTMFMTQEGKVEATIEELVDATTTVPEHWNTVLTITDSVDSEGNVIANGNEAFGDFAHIMKDLRLPSRENTSYFGIAYGAGENDDVPSVTGHYTQYTIQLTSERGVLQQSAVGGVGVSRTVHVFYVESAATTNFEAALYGAGITAAATAAATTTPDSTIADTRNTGGVATV